MGHKVDITIIGGGVIGLAVAAQVSDNKKEVCLLEKNSSYGQETSSRNSEVIHSGIYYPKDSLKAKMCIEGKKILYELCKKTTIPYKKTGKLIVACENEEIVKLEGLVNRGNNNGVSDLKIISKQEIKKIEPNIKAEAAIYSPSTGIIDSYRLMKYFAQKAEENRAIISCGSEVVGIEKITDGYRIIVKESAGQFLFETKILINCAGLNSDKIAEFVGMDISKLEYKIHFCKGEYFSIGKGKDSMVKRLIYPVPSEISGGLGIHVTMDLQGRMKLGPNAYYVENIDYKVDDFHKKDFFESASKFLPFIEYDDIEPAMAGIRPKLEIEGGAFRDFIIKDENDNGFPGFINLIGIESPGLTASPSIAKYVANLVNEIGA